MEYTESMDTLQQLRKRVRETKTSGYRLAKDSKLRISVVQRILAGGGATVATLERLAAAVGCRVELRPIGRPLTAAAKGK